MEKCHVNYVANKACKKLYSLRVLYRAGVSSASILKEYLTTIRPVLEYAVPVWQSVPDYLADVKEGIYSIDSFPCRGVLYGGPGSS